MPLKDMSLPQPWTRTVDERKPVSTLHLRFFFQSSADLSTVGLALEDPEITVVRLDGKPIPSKRTGWFTDENISVVELAPISKGQHVIELDIAFGLLTNAERIYLLGDFSVHLHGDKACLAELDLSLLRFGDYTRQGLPFYAGNVTYHCTYEVPRD